MAGRRPIRPRNVIRVTEVDLMMECEDEELSPWQQEHTKRAEIEYRSAMDQIKKAKANNMTITRQEAGIPPAPSPRARASRPTSRAATT